MRGLSSTVLGRGRGSCLSCLCKSHFFSQGGLSMALTWALWLEAAVRARRGALSMAWSRAG